MIDYSTFKLMHRHGDDWVELHPHGHHDVAEHDPERTWMRHSRLYRCSGCDEEVMIVPNAGLEEEGAGPPV
jgi:hypothetical protein